MKKTLEQRVQKLYATIEAEERQKREKETSNGDKLKLNKKPKPPAHLAKEKAEGTELVTIKDLAYETKTSPKALRKIFRKVGIKKPTGRWEWPANSDSYMKAKAAISGHLNG